MASQSQRLARREIAPVGDADHDMPAVPCVLPVDQRRGILFGRFRQPLSQFGVPLVRVLPPHRDGHRFFLPHDDDQPLAAGDGRVQQVPPQHRVLLGRERNDDGRILRALAFVDGRRVGKHDPIEFGETIQSGLLIEAERSPNSWTPLDLTRRTYPLRVL